MDINYNEKEQLEEILKENKLIKNEWYTLMLLTKYCCLEHYTEEETWEFIEEHLKAIIPRYKTLDYKEMINKCIKTFLNRTNVVLSDVKRIPIYKEEIEFIEKNVPKESYQKLAFGFLCYRKILNYAYDKHDTVIPSKYKTIDIFKVSNMTQMGQQAEDVICKLINSEILKTMGFYKDSKGELRINITDNRLEVPYIKFEGEVAFEVEAKDFENLGLVWLLYKGNKKVMRFVRFGLLIHGKGKERTKYCKECAKLVNIEKTLENKKKKSLIC